MKRGEVWTAAGGAPYASKPRPVLVVQADRFDATASVVVCPFTSTDLPAASLLRVGVEPNADNGLTNPSSLMIDKITAMPRGALRSRIGVLADTEMARVNRSLLVFLGIA